jgi:hypothetical protein
MKKLILLVCALGMAVSSWGAYSFMTDSIYYHITSSSAKTVEVVNNDTTGCYTKTSYTLPSSVTNSSTGITYTVTAIGASAFKSCSNITSISIPSTITSIRKNAFYGSRVTSFTIPASVDSIYTLAFNYCSRLASMNIPSSVTYIGEGAFRYCGKLKGITTDNVNANYTSVDSVLFTKSTKTLICYPAGKPETSYTVPSAVDSIYPSAFDGAAKLTAINLSSSVTTVGSNAFFGCGLKSIAFPASVKSIGATALYACDYLASITVDKANTKYAAVDSVLFSKDLKTLICYAPMKPETKYAIPSSVDSITNYAFVGCFNLTSITIPNNVTTLGYYVFNGCLKLTSISIPSSISSIPDGTFSSCSVLKTVDLPNSITSIGRGAFDNCDSLTSITLPASITSIDAGAFFSCSALTDIYAYPTTPVNLTYSYNVFYGVDTTKCTLHVPSGSLDAYKAADVWKGFKLAGDLSAVTNATASAVKVTVRNSQAVITGTEAGTALSVYNLQGTAIYTGKTSGETESITLPQRGVYIVRVGSRSVKVVY